MPPAVYRVYIQFGGYNCVRLFAKGKGILADDGLQLFEWMREPSNLVRLRIGLQHVYEVDQRKLQHFLDFKLRGDRGYMEEQMKKYPRDRDMVAALKKQHARFNSLRTGLDKLEAISNAREITVIPQVSPRRISDKPGWLYMLNLDHETLEIYEFKDHGQRKSTPVSRLTIDSLYQKSPGGPPGYYVKLKLSQLQATRRSGWTRLHNVHAKALDQLWKRNGPILQTIPHADTLPFAVLYGSVFNGENRRGMQPSKPTRLTQARLTQVVAALSRRQPSKLSIFDSKGHQRRPVRGSSEHERKRSLKGG